MLTKIITRSISSTVTKWRHPKSVDYVKEILESRVYEVAKKTPLVHAPQLSNTTGHNIFLKREDLQPTFGFNLRGAHHKISKLTLAQQSHGIVSVAAGNHAQGVALSASTLGIDATVVVPVGTLPHTIRQISSYSRSTKVVTHGRDFKEAWAYATAIAKKDSKCLIHPFDDVQVIAGQGTIAMELLTQHSDIDYIFCPVGGGGMLAGVLSYVSAVAPHIKVVGVESTAANPMTHSLSTGKNVAIDDMNLFTDSAAISKVGNENFKICKEQYEGGVLHDVISVTTDEICAAIKSTFEETRSLMEPLGAITVAGVSSYFKKSSDEKKQKNVVAVLSAANMDFDRLRFVAERSDDRERFMAVTIPEVPGSFQKLYDILSPRNVTEFSYRMHCALETNARICMSIQTKTVEDYERVISDINNNSSNDMKAVDLSQNELAKSHVRHLVGGRVKHQSCERLFRLEFPERPGALKEFLQALGDKTWNVSLFHYRNHGADIGRVLVAFQVEPEENTAFMAFLNKLGFDYVEETDNPVYKQYLC